MVPEIHILRSEANDRVFAHAHDEQSFHFLDMVLQTGWPGLPWEPETWEGQCVFPLAVANDLVQMAKFEGLSVVDGPHCLEDV